MPIKIKRIDHFVLTTNNVLECVKFYELIGFEFKGETGKNVLYCQNFKINLHEKGKELLPHAKYVQTGSADFCFEMDMDTQQCKKQLEAYGLEIVEGPVHRIGFKGNMSSLYLYDPDGNLIELSSYK